MHSPIVIRNSYTNKHNHKTYFCWDALGARVTGSFRGTWQN